MPRTFTTNAFIEIWRVIISLLEFIMCCSLLFKRPHTEKVLKQCKNFFGKTEKLTSTQKSKKGLQCFTFLSDIRNKPKSLFRISESEMLSKNS